MKQLDISITKAALESFTVSAVDGKPSVTVTIALLTEGGKKITNYTAMTDAYSANRKIELPISAMPLIGELARILEAQAVSKCRDEQMALPAPSNDLNLSEIPF